MMAEEDERKVMGWVSEECEKVLGGSKDDKRKMKSVRRWRKLNKLLIK